MRESLTRTMLQFPDLKCSVVGRFFKMYIIFKVKQVSVCLNIHIDFCG